MKIVKKLIDPIADRQLSSAQCWHNCHLMSAAGPIFSDALTMRAMDFFIQKQFPVNMLR